MSPQDFSYWLQGFSELTGEVPTAAQWRAIQEHLQLTFKKVTGPSPDQLRPYYEKLGYLDAPQSIC